MLKNIEGLLSRIRLRNVEVSKGLPHEVTKEVLTINEKEEVRESSLGNICADICADMRAHTCIPFKESSLETSKNRSP